ncbi:XTP/dITP diphosphatase [Desulfovibrio inopinatus]|uniref:XTP/dITP diphosphatase n=1 Tax=Desulfovibrio inopinatus TaxID=102109 RepID=UPI000414BDE7|nr:XTP/dITP diphosphatase [Desulfovibrio inopinatus]
MTAHTIVLATRNNGKIAEIEALLSDFNVVVKGLGDYPEIGEIPETGTTFAENARIKACAVAQATGLVALADDSGLVVDALDGAPGVYSARFAGETASDDDNNTKLLNELKNVPDDQRQARFVCVLCACRPDGETLFAEGFWEGEILRDLRGTNGFGYDPLFYDPAAQKASAEMTRDEKSSRSHRGQALAALKTQWLTFFV